MIKVAVLLIAYNRKTNVKKVLEILRQVGISKLYVACDGAKNSEKDAEKVLETRKTIKDSIDWKCEVSYRFSEKNQGCKFGPINAINWVFEQEERAIILEDDIVPDPSFFTFCDQLLEKYCDNTKIMMISGCNIMTSTESAAESYFFEPLATTWGWATWARAWRQYDVSMQGWEEIKRKKVLKKMFMKDTAFSLERDFDSVADSDLDAWDYQWQYAMINNRAYGIVPKYCMVENIGFLDADATHTDGLMFAYQGLSMPFPLIHPTEIKGNREYEIFVEKQVYHVNYFHVFLKQILPKKLVKKIMKIRGERDAG